MYAVRVQVSIHVSKNKDLIPFGYSMQGLSKLRPEFRPLLQEGFLVLRLVGSSPQGPGVLITNKHFYARVRLKSEM